MARKPTGLGGPVLWSQGPTGTQPLLALWEQGSTKPAPCPSAAAGSTEALGRQCLAPRPRSAGTSAPACPSEELLFREGSYLPPPRACCPGLAEGRAGKPAVGKPQRGRCARGAGHSVLHLLPTLPKALESRAFTPAQRQAQKQPVGMGEGTVPPRGGHWAEATALRAAPRTGSCSGQRVVLQSQEAHLTGREHPVGRWTAAYGVPAPGAAAGERRAR